MLLHYSFFFFFLFLSGLGGGGEGQAGVYEQTRNTLEIKLYKYIYNFIII